MFISEKIGRYTRINHYIQNEKPEYPNTLSSYILLKNFYSEIDDTNDDWHYYFIIRRHFLRRRKRENGGKYWNCHYCGKPVYKMQERNTNKQDKDCITVDHIVPVSLNIDKLDTSNMVECCSECNNKKGLRNMNYLNWN